MLIQQSDSPDAKLMQGCLIQYTWYCERHREDSGNPGEEIRLKSTQDNYLAWSNEENRLE